MKIQFIGATGTVTGSKYLLTADKKKYLVDCGLFQGLKVLRLRNWGQLPFKARDIEDVILTHAHIDHSGYLPLLVKNGFSGNIYATPASKALCQILLPDAGHLQEEDATFANKHHFSRHTPALPLYTEKDALRSLKQLRSVPWNKKKKLTEKLSCRFNPVGHILGASQVQFDHVGTKITFSGDLGRPHNLIMNPPSPLEATDYLVIESTYGNRAHPKENPENIFSEMVNRTVARGGIILVPSFAVGRAQEILYLVSKLKKNKRIPDVPVYLNSPMAIDATRLYAEFPQDHALSSDEVDEMCRSAKFIHTMEESKYLNTLKEPSIIISASGMATGGRVLHHLKSLAPDPKNLILFIGFQAAGTRGEAMLRGVPSVKIHGEMVSIKAEVASIDSLSAHADADEIISWLKSAPRAPKMTFVTHGEPLASEALRKRIEEELNWPCKVPDYLETCDLK